MPGKKRRGAQSVASDEVARLLIPQIRFLRAAGVTASQMEEVLKAEFQRQIPKASRGRVERVQFNNQCARLIANWKVLPDFLDLKGSGGSACLDRFLAGVSGSARAVDDDPVLLFAFRQR